MKTVRLLILRLFSYFPTKIPVGMTAYLVWSDSIVELIGPIANKSDLEFCIAAEVLRVKPDACSAPKNYFVKRVRAGAAKQIAGAVFTRIKEEQMAVQKAAEIIAQEAVKRAQQAAEATPAQQAGFVSNEKVGIQQTQS